MKSGKIIVISGFSGVGKGTVIKRLMEAHPETFSFSTSATTRAPRPGEVNGREYYFISREFFELMINDNRLLEYTEYQGNYYGTPLEYTEKTLNEGKDVLFDIEVVGAMNIAKHDLPSVSVYMLPPSIAELTARLKKRGSESKEQINGRLSQARWEADYIGRYDNIIINHSVEETTALLYDIINGKEQSPEERAAMLAHAEALSKELDEILK